MGRACSMHLKTSINANAVWLDILKKETTLKTWAYRRG
jgi:hypothetical protein